MKNRNAALLMMIALLFSLMIGACGSRPATTATDSENQPAASSKSGGIAAMPTANFKAIGAQSNMTITTKSEESAEDAAADLVLGERVYGNKCADCHGPNGAGTDSAVAVAETQLTFSEFEDLLRTGGEIGPDHLFGMRAVSANGMAALYAYLASAE